MTANVGDSFWDRYSSECDICIVGGGIIGASSAIEIATAHPELRIVLIEKSNGPHGASTRNAGFACYGSLSEITSDIDLLGADVTRRLVQQRYEGLQILRNRCGDEHINYEAHGGNEIFLDHHPALDRIDEVNTLLDGIFSGPAFIRDDNQVLSFRLQALGLVHTPYEGMLHSGLLVQRLWQLAQQLGVKIIQNDVTRIAPTIDGRYELSLVNGAIVSATKVVLATNARINELMSSPEFVQGRPSSLAPSPEFDQVRLSSLMLIPARGQIIVTEPIPDLAIKGTFHYNSGYVYFRNVGNRVLLGGGRDIAFEEEETLSMETTPRIQNYLEEFLHNVVLPRQNVQIDYRWAGTMAFSNTKRPIVEEIMPGVIVAFGCNGMGVAIGSFVARQVNLLIS